MVSTSPFCPSTLHVRCLENWGLPNRHGKTICDGYVLHIQFNRNNDTLMHVYATRAEPDVPETSFFPPACTIS